MKNRAVMSWNDCSRHCEALWGDSWQTEFMKRCRVTKATIRRWSLRGEIRGPVVRMVEAFVSLRKYGLELP